ncbi:hypothetical protein WA171_001809 [Blastocystis sp. BT1]
MVVCGCYTHNESAFLLSENEDVVCSSTLPEYVSLLQDTSSSLSKLEALPAITQEAKACLSCMGDKEKLKAGVLSLKPAICSIAAAYHITHPICEAAKDIICRLANTDDWRSETLYISTLLSCLHCCIWFDSIKVSNPNINNTLFFYKRCSVNVASMMELPITEEESGEITGFLGEHQPMQQLLLSTVQGISDHREESISILQEICNTVIHSMNCLDTYSKSTQLHFISSLVALLVLLDGILPTGIYRKESHLQISSAISILVHQGNEGKHSISILRYSCHSYPQAPKHIRRVIEKNLQ